MLNAGNTDFILFAYQAALTVVYPLSMELVSILCG